MAFKKKTAICTGTGSLVQTVDLGSAYAKAYRFDLLSNVDTSVALTVTDAEGVTVGTFTSADYTTETRYYVGPVPTGILDAAGDAGADAEGTPIGVVVTSPLTLTASGLDASETLTVDVFYEV